MDQVERECAVKMMMRLTRVSCEDDPATFRGVSISDAVIWSPSTGHQDLVDFEFERGMETTKIFVYSFLGVNLRDVGVQVTNR